MNTTAQELTFSDVAQAVIRYVPGMDPDEGSAWVGWILDTYGRHGYGYTLDELPTMPNLWREYAGTMGRSIAMRATDITGYTFRADTYCPSCIVVVLPTGEGEQYDGWQLAAGARMSAEDNLDEIAHAFGIDRQDEYSFDSDDFPKVVFASQVDGDTCGRCGAEL